MKKLIALALAGLLCVSKAYGQPACDKVVYVGSWNIQWLGNAKAGKRKPQKPADIASYLAVSKVDVLALAEISVTSRDSNGKARNQSLDEAFAIANSGAAKWQYELFAKREGARAPEDQWTGVAWNEASVAKVGGPWKLEARIDASKEESIKQRMNPPEAETVIFSRWPYAVKFSAGKGKTDFVVVPVHWKSNIGGAATAEARAYETELLVESLRKSPAAHGEEDFIILGDSNMLRADEDAANALKGAGLRDCNARDLGTHLSFKAGERGAPFDRIFVMGDQAETSATCPATGNGRNDLDFKLVRAAEWRQGVTNSQFRNRLSDHLLVRTGICVVADDD